MKKKQHFFRKIKVQIIIFYMAASIVTVGLIGFILYQSISGVILEKTVETQRKSVEQSGIYIGSYVDKMKGLTQVIVENPATSRYLLGEESKERDKEDILALIQSSMTSDPYIASIIIIGKEGQLLSNEKELNMSMSSDMMKEAWYVAAIEANCMPSLTSARMQKFNMKKDDWVISSSQEITDREGNNMGVVVVDFNYAVIEDHLEGLDFGKEGYGFIINEEQQVVYHKDTNYFMDLAKQEELIAIVAKEEGYSKKDNLVYSSYQLENADWILMGVSSLDELSVVRRQLTGTILLIGSLCLFLVILMGIYIADRITKPISRLEKVMSQIETKFDPIQLENSGSYEVESLSSHYNEMIRQIKGLMKDVATKEKAIRSYELTVLHSQINPHFLYNTLDTIIWMAEFGDHEKVIKLIKALAKFFRLSLSGGSKHVTIASELEHVRQYLIIQKERYEDQLTYKINEEPSLAKIKIPKIIVQPIVENAIYHGIRDLNVPGYIHIQVAKVGEEIHFIVEDNGHGFDVTKIEAPQLEKVKLGGVGLKNVDKRIRLSYGERYGVQVQSTLGKGTKVIIRLPFRTMEE